MPATEELSWLTVRPDDIAKLERLATIVDDVSAHPHGLAVALRRTPSYRAASQVGRAADLPGC
jgi:hypothetical protein